MNGFRSARTKPSVIRNNLAIASLVLVALSPAISNAQNSESARILFDGPLSCPDAPFSSLSNESAEREIRVLVEPILDHFEMRIDFPDATRVLHDASCRTLVEVGCEVIQIWLRDLAGPEDATLAATVPDASPEPGDGIRENESGLASPPHQTQTEETADETAEETAVESQIEAGPEPLRAAEEEAAGEAELMTPEAPSPDSAVAPSRENEMTTSTGEPRHSRMRLSAQASVMTRSLSATVEIDTRLRLPGASAFEEREYRSTHPELGAELLVFPGAFFERQVIPWLGFRFSYRADAGLKTVGFTCNPETDPSPSRCPTTPGFVDIDSTQRDIFAGIHLSFELLDSNRVGANVFIEAGYGRLSMLLNTTQLQQLERGSIFPPMDYESLRLRAGFRYHFHRYVSAAVLAGYEIGVSVGSDAQKIWGVETSGFDGIQIGAELTHHMDYLAEGLFFRLRYQYLRNRTDFSGQTVCAEAGCLPGELWEQWPSSEDQVTGGLQEPALDIYMRIGILLGYEF